jgi:hypothetical protein
MAGDNSFPAIFNPFNFSPLLPLIKDEHGELPSIPVKIERHGVHHANKERS